MQQQARKQATIQTAIVEIKTITVSSKQMTLSVFRQLDEAGILVAFDANGREIGRHREIPDDARIEMRGTPWGRVNYHPDRSCRGREGWHFHIVWQGGDRLFRDSIEYQCDRSTTASAMRTLTDLPQIFIAV